VTRASSTFGLPGDIENLVGLQADHSTVCKFGPSEEDQDNLELVLANVQDLYKVLLEEGEREDEKDGESLIPSLPSAPSTDLVNGDKLEARLKTLRRSP